MSDIAPPAPHSPPHSDPRDRAVDALMTLAATRRWAEIDLAEIAAAAGMSLRELRTAFPSKGAILGAFSRRIDLEVLAGDTADLAAEPPRERVFDILMRRFEALRPYRAALASIRDGVATEPLTLAALNGTALNAMQWMLAAAGISTTGFSGAAKAQAMVLLQARLLGTFLADDDPSLTRTMKALDEELRAAEPWIRRAEEARATLQGFASVLRPRRREAPPAPLTSEDPIAGSDLTAPL
jgi:AcrR family transcriptional regulator